MRIANASGRLVLVDGEATLDVERASGGRFGADPQAIYARFDEFSHWAASAPAADGPPVRPEALGAPAPRPSQLFAIGLNYRAHAAETGIAAPPYPSVFTKFRSAITGPDTTVELPDGDVDWEVELVAVIG